MSTSYVSDIRQLREGVGELIARHDETRGVADFARYKGRVEAFAREELGFTPYGKQIEMFESFTANKRTVVQGCHGAGKDAALACIALYAAFVEGMLVLVVSATERQLLGQLWREIGARFSPRLPGALYTADLRIGGEKRIIAMTSGSTSNLTGWHHEHGVAVLISESQSEAVGDTAFDAALANAVDDASRIVVVGNPIRAVGRFYEVTRKETWRRIQISAFDLPNIIEQRVVHPGMPAPSWPAEMEAEVGIDSPWYKSRVLGEFPPVGSIDALVKAATVDEANAKWLEGGLRPTPRGPVVGLDVARSEARDESCAAVAQGARIHSLATWRVRDLVATTNRAIAVAKAAWREWMLTAHSPDELSSITTPPVPLFIDASGIGSGCCDEAKRQGYPYAEHWGWRPSSDPTRHLNVRSDAYLNLKRLLETGAAQLPPDPLLREEILSTEWTEDAKGRIVIGNKDILRAALKRSPDRCDAVTIALLNSAPSARQAWRTVRVKW
jgi:hypothetical protein